MLVTFEGIDASGKSTLKNRLEKNYSENPSAVFTSEPYDDGGDTYKLIYEHLRGNKDNPIELFYLYFANHVSHVESVIRPSLAKDKTIFCDRYYDSMLVYQSSDLQDFLNIEQEPLLENSLLSSFEKMQNVGDFQVEPDITFYIDISPETAVQRIASERDIQEKFETKQHLEEIREKYQKLVQQKGRFVQINGEQSKDEVYNECVDILTKKGVLPL